MTIQLDDFILIDNHAHPLLKRFLQLDAIALRQSFSESRSIGQLRDHLDKSVFYMDMVDKLSRLTGTLGEEGILDFREKQSERDYLNLLWDDVSIGGLIVDDGFRSDEMIDLARLSELSGRSVFRCVRIEGVLEQCICEASSFEELSELFRERLSVSGSPPTVALKSILAYRGGLELEPVGADCARNDFDGVKRLAGQSPDWRIARSPLYDYLLLEAFELAAANGWPVQLHCGLGDDDADLRLSNPLCFRAVLKGSCFSAAAFVFLHCYPYVREAAYLASIYPSVYLDLSLSASLVSPSAELMIREALSQAPSTKILAGTDGHSTPESHWYGAYSWRRALTAVLNNLIAERFVSETQALDIAGRLLHENARALYSLDGLS